MSTPGSRAKRKQISVFLVISNKEQNNEWIDLHFYLLIAIMYAMLAVQRSKKPSDL